MLKGNKIYIIALIENVPPMEIIFSESTLDQVLKIVQIVFYIVGIIAVILTYWTAKSGLLNTVNTEYQKKVMDRLKELSDELASEFDPDSPNYWLKTDPITEVVNLVNQRFLENQEMILKTGIFPPGVPVGKDFQRLSRLITNIKTDPFIPSRIRNLVVDSLGKRADAIMEIYISEISEYINKLAKGKNIKNPDKNLGLVHNKIVDRLEKNGFGLVQVEKDVDNIRLAIQDYFISYDPLPKRKNK
jgi:hypothetical protein